MKTVQDLIKNLTCELEEGSSDPSWLLIQALTKKTKTQLILEHYIKLTPDQDKILKKWILQYVNEKKPLQYIIGNVPFLDLEILVEPPILIPRPETESWCNELILKLKLLENKKIRILDIGSGTGCIALSLAKYFEQAQVYAVDISTQALELAKRNAIQNKVKNITFIHSDLFSNLQKTLKFDLIVSNPPYIDEKLFDSLDKSVKDWEDPKALICKESGLYLIKKIINQAKDYLKFNKEFKEKNIPQVVLEIDYTQAKFVSDYLQKHNFFNIKVDKDIYQKERVVSAGI